MLDQMCAISKIICGGFFPTCFVKKISLYSLRIRDTQFSKKKFFYKFHPTLVSIKLLQTIRIWENSCQVFYIVTCSMLHGFSWEEMRKDQFVPDTEYRDSARKKKIGGISALWIKCVLEYKECRVSSVWLAGIHSIEVLL